MALVIFGSVSLWRGYRVGVLAGCKSSLAINPLTYPWALHCVATKDGVVIYSADKPVWNLDKDDFIKP